MMLWLLALLPALAADDLSFEELVRRDLDPVAARYTPDEMQARLEALCDDGDADACAVREGGRLVDWALATCEAEADPFACQAVAWHEQADAPAAAFERLEALCAEGWGSACADTARAYLEGTGAWQSRRKARQIAEAACGEGDARSCLLIVEMDRRARPLAMEQLAQEAYEAGRAEALVPLAALARAEQEEAVLRQACQAGNGVPCREVAQRVHERSLDDGELLEEVPNPEQGDEVPELDLLAPPDLSDLDEFDLLERGCALRDDASCVIVALAGYDTGRLSRSETEDALDTLCATVDEACIERGYLREGGDVRAFKDGEPQPLQSERIEQSMSGYFLDCYRDYVDRDPSLDTVEFEIHAWLDEVGEIRGATVRSDATDAAFDTCIASELLGREYPAPVDATKIVLPMGISHEAVVQVRSRTTDVRTELVLEVESLMAPLAVQADRCYLDHGGSAWDRVFSLRKLKVRRDGAVELGKLVESTGLDEADTCVQELFSGFAVDPLDYQEKAELYLRFVVSYREPKQMGVGHGDAMDEDLYMNRGDPEEYSDALDDL